MSKPSARLSGLGAPLGDGRHHHVADVLRGLPATAPRRRRSRRRGAACRGRARPGRSGRSGRGSRPMKWKWDWNFSPCGGSSPRGNADDAGVLAHLPARLSMLAVPGLDGGRCDTPSPMTPGRARTRRASRTTVPSRPAYASNRRHAGAELEPLGARGVGHQQRHRVARRDVRT